MNDSPPVRRTVRAIMLDAEDRILMFRIEDDTSRAPGVDAKKRIFWITPGGGAWANESDVEAVRREVCEETGITNREADFGSCIWRGVHDLLWNDALVRVDERFFLVRVRSASIDIGGMEPLERSVYRAHRWWSLGELASTDEIILPKDLAALLPPLIEGAAYPNPIEIDLSNPPELDR
jgi:8-oxo-dGTP pyrophosphatase MutT (NUDIX family)